MKFDNFMTNERNLAKELADKFSPDDPTFAKDLLGILINAAYGDEIDFSTLFGKDGADEITKAFGLGDDPVTVTKTTTSVGGLPGDIGATPEEAEAIANNMLGERPIDLKETDERTNFADALVSAESDEDVRELCAKYGINIDEDDGIEAPEDTDPGSNAGLDKANMRRLKNDLDNATDDPHLWDHIADENEKRDDPEDEPEDEPKADKPAEDKKEDKPKEEKKEPPKEEKKEEPKADKPAEDKKDEPDDTMKNITSALSNRI